MNREEKATQIVELRERFAKASVALVTSNLGLTVDQSTRLRRAVKAVGGECKVSKHTLTKLALDGGQYSALTEFLVGPRSLVFGYEDPVAVAKALVDFAQQNNKLQVDGGAVEGEVLSAAEVKGLAAMPDLPTLQGRIVMQAMGPGARLASAIGSPATRIAGAIEALAKKKEEEGPEA